MKIDTFEKIALRLKVLSRDGMKPETAAWIDETERIARDAATNGGETVGAEVAKPGCISDIVPDGREKTSFEKFMTVSSGVTFVRFHGKDEILLVARRKGSSGNPNTIFQISVNKATKCASVFRDDRLLFDVTGATVGYSKVEAMAVSALKRWFKDQRKCNAQRRRKRKARLAAMNGGEQDGAETARMQVAGAQG